MARRKILLIDDYRPFVASLRLALSADFEIEIADSMNEGLDRLRKSAFDAVLCDVLIPGGSGIDLFRQVQAASLPVATRFVFLTGGGTSDDAEAFLAQVANPTLRKPFSLPALLSTLGRLFERGDQAVAR